MVTLGIKPVRPETGYGYIGAGRAISLPNQRGTAFHAETFVEKPGIEKARGFCSDGSYYWNSGIFFFTPGTLEKELCLHAADVAEMFNAGYDRMLQSFEMMPSISIDYAVMEKSANVAVIPAVLDWNDIGSWDALFDLRGGRTAENYHDSTIAIDSPNTLVVGNTGRLVATVGMENCIIVDTDDALLVIGKGKGQKIREVTEQLRKQGRKEVEEHSTTLKPWGSFTTLLEGPGYKVKRLMVNPGEKLSLQYHRYRREHWTVVRGSAKVTLADREHFLEQNEVMDIPVRTLHRVENCEAVPVEIIEVQCGQYLGEDDIVRIDDKYGRVTLTDSLREQENEG